MEEDTQEPTAPQGAPSAPSVEPPPAAAEAAETTPSSETQIEAPAPVSADWSHLRGLQAVEAPAPGWVERADYAEEFAKELSTRAARFVRSVDDSVVLSSDGVLRWLGEPVARIVADEKVLAPRAVLLADEALAGEEREAAQNRANLWLAAHVKKLLGPLVALEDGVELPEAAKALGAKIGEALGVLDRERVRNEVRSLDQSTRGAFRKLGVRFGSLYLYVPQLLKPGPRALATQLYMLKRGAEAGADQLLAFASAGRTSFANDGALSPEAYRVAGFRLCGERVVRVDIVERLSDLIRAATPDHMRSGSRNETEGQGFAVSPQMTSLTGCSGEAFASILRSLNFEPHKVSKAAFELARRKAPTEPIKPAAETAEAPPEAAELEVADTAAETMHEAADLETVATVESDAQTHEAAAPQLEAVPALEPAPETQTPEAPIVEPAPVAHDGSAAHETAEPEGAVTAEAGETSASPEAVEPTQVVDEEIEVWRPAPRRQRAPQRPPRAERPAQGPNRRPHHAPEAERPAASGEAAAAPTEPPRRRDETPRRFQGKGEGRFEGKGDKRPREERQRDERREFTPRRDSRPADPDSPFAKLAALKPLLEQRDKRN